MGARLWRRVRRQFREAYEQAIRSRVGTGALPGFAGGKTMLSVSQFAARLKGADFAVVVGAALFEHPLGVKAGAASIRRACEEIAGLVDPPDQALAEAMRVAIRQARSYHPC